MKLVTHFAWYTMRDLARNRWGIMYMLFFAILTVGLHYMQAQSAKVAVSLLSVCLFLIPLVSSLFGSIYFYNSREFVELVLTQPVSRRTVLLGMYIGLAAGLAIGMLVGIGLPSAILGNGTANQWLSLLSLVGIGTFLTLIFVALSFLIAIIFDDRGKGLAAALGVWLFSALIYDGLVLFAATRFSEYPLEMPLLIATMANPIDLARVTLLVNTDWAALMGYTGAVFNRFFGTGLGVVVATLSLMVWTFGPLGFALRRFRTKDM